MSHDPVITRDRLAAVRAGLPEDAVALLGDLADILWLTGLGSSNAAVVVAEQSAWLITDFRYRSAAEALTGPASGLELVVGGNLVAEAAALVKGSGATRLVLERDRTTLAQDEQLAEVLGDGVERIPADRLVEAARAIKNPGEVERIAAAQALADAAFREVVMERGIVGRTEQAVALELEIAMRRAGAEDVSFAPIVAAGSHGALPHAHPRDVQIPRDELVVIDWGCKLDGYCSDCTRTVATGRIDERRQAVHQIVRDAQEVALGLIAPGVAGVEVDAAARELIAAAGYGDHFGHGLGHGVGLEVHEAPNLSPRSKSTLAAGHVVTVEPGIYLPGEFGVRVEELVVVGAGGPRVLTGLPRGADVS